ncbi:MAG: DUF3137 domain-containing protein [Lachnospiraceae bacterium]|nr:DUF3137 domain-containing protein [Lachnospiraceae bacterium]
MIEYIFATRYSETRNKYMLVYKEVLVAPSLANKFEHYTYSPDGTVTTNDILAIGIWNTTHGSLESRTEDFLKGTYKGVYYEQVGASVWLRLTKIDTVSVFDGTISKFRFNKAISGKLVIARSINPNIFSVDGLSAIKTDNAEFNRQLTIFSSQGHEAFYILTPHFMECILKLYNGYPRMMIIVFEHDTMTILRSGAKMCEFSEAKKVDFFEARAKIIGEMQNMLDIVDTLNIGNTEK